MKTAEAHLQAEQAARSRRPGTAEYQALQQQAAAYLVTQEEYEQQAARLGVKVTDADVG